MSESPPGINHPDFPTLADWEWLGERAEQQLIANEDKIKRLMVVLIEIAGENPCRTPDQLLAMNAIEREKNITDGGEG
jgi:hypothetical protein